MGPKASILSVMDAKVDAASKKGQLTSWQLLDALQFRNTTYLSIVIQRTSSAGYRALHGKPKAVIGSPPSNLLWKLGSLAALVLDGWVDRSGGTTNRIPEIRRMGF